MVLIRDEASVDVVEGASSPHPSPPFGMEERVPEGRERRCS
jgi:hypothetical protein